MIDYRLSQLAQSLVGVLFFIQCLSQELLSVVHAKFFGPGAESTIAADLLGLDRERLLLRVLLARLIALAALLSALTRLLGLLAWGLILTTLLATLVALLVLLVLLAALVVLILISHLYAPWFAPPLKITAEL